jgi:hypothetical protein
MACFQPYTPTLKTHGPFKNNAVFNSSIVFTRTKLDVLYLFASFLALTGISFGVNVYIVFESISEYQKVSSVHVPIFDNISHASDKYIP